MIISQFHLIVNDCKGLALFHSIHDGLRNLVDQPSLGRLDVIPHDEVPCNCANEQEVGLNKVERSDRVWNCHNLSYVLATSLEIHETQG